MQMNNLENTIREHAEELFGSEPLQGHRDRFADRLAAVNSTERNLTVEKLNNAERNLTVEKLYARGDEQVAGNGKRWFTLRKTIGYASIAAAFIGCVILLQHNLKPENEPLSEVQNYYSMQLEDKIDELEQLLRYVDEKDRPDLMNDIENMLQEAETDIRSSGENNAELIVTTYSTKIEALEHVQDLLANYITH